MTSMRYSKKRVLIVNMTVAFLMFLIHVSAWAKAVELSKVSFKKAIYLGDNEAATLKDDLIRSRFNDETFNLIFRCDKYKRSPSSKSRSLNCVAVTVAPTVENGVRGSSRRR